MNSRLQSGLNPPTDDSLQLLLPLQAPELLEVRPPPKRGCARCQKDRKIQCLPRRNEGGFKPWLLCEEAAQLRPHTPAKHRDSLPPTPPKMASAEPRFRIFEPRGGARRAPRSLQRSPWLGASWRARRVGGQQEQLQLLVSRLLVAVDPLCLVRLSELRKDRPKRKAGRKV